MFVCNLVSFFFQLKNQDSLQNCSYFDPVTVDFLAFFIAIFLIVEGIYRISEHKNMSIKNQFTRSLRIAFGCAILTTHIVQFIHK